VVNTSVSRQDVKIMRSTGLMLHFLCRFFVYDKQVLLFAKYLWLLRKYTVLHVRKNLPIISTAEQDLNLGTM